MGHPTADRLDLILDLLSEADRRRLLYVLTAHGELSVDRLAEVLVGTALGQNGEAVAKPAQYRRTLTALRHAHLPRLADADVVRVDEAAETVSLAEPHPVLEELLAVTRRIETGPREQPHQSPDGGPAG
jgi:hypothetical protein